MNSVVPFVCALVPGTTREHAHAARTALPGLRPAEAGSYWEHSHQSWRLKHRRTSPPAPGTTPAALAPCAVSHSLRPCGHVSWTPIASASDRVCPGLPSRHSFPHLVGCGFRRPEYRSGLLSLPVGRCPFGTVSAWTHWQGLDAPLIVELFAVRLLSAEPRRQITSGFSVSPREDSRRQQRWANLTGLAPGRPRRVLVHSPTDGI